MNGELGVTDRISSIAQSPPGRDMEKEPETLVPQGEAEAEMLTGEGADRARHWGQADGRQLPGSGIF